ncbi:MAG: PfkB family carbohydrate kinase, partial [Planctomycetota bacterium]|nr:PfkB family carbohydrate kinase [Planctomycetota bacterium]
MELSEMVRSLGKKRVAVVGEIMLDRYLWGSVERISPEAPIPVMRLDETEERLGGAGCVVNNLLTFGAEVMPVSVLGADSQGEKLLAILREKGVSVESILTEEDRPTIVKTRMIGYVQSAHRATQHILRLDEERRERIKEETERHLCKFVEDAIR